MKSYEKNGKDFRSRIYSCPDFSHTGASADGEQRAGGYQPDGGKSGATGHTDSTVIDPALRTAKKCFECLLFAPLSSEYQLLLAL